MVREHLECDRTCVVAVSVFVKVELDKGFCIKLLARDGICAILFDVGYNVDEIEDVTLWSADGVLEGGERQGTAIVGEALEGAAAVGAAREDASRGGVLADLARPFGMGDVEFVGPLAHDCAIEKQVAARKEETVVTD